jgi:transcriptional regulator GlxA family with amidase domain
LNIEDVYLEERAIMDALAAGARRQRQPGAESILPDIRVGIVLSPQFTLLPFAGLVESLRHAADEADRSRQIYCQWSIVAETLDPVEASCGVQVTPTDLFGDPHRFDYVAIVGGRLEAFSTHRQRTFEFLREAFDAGCSIIGLCTGSFAMAKAGLLDGRNCAVHWRHESELRQAFPNVRPITGKHFVADGGLITCPGGVASVPLAFTLLEKHCGRTRALKSLAQMSVEQEYAELPRLPDLFAEVSSFSDRHVERSVQLMREKLSEAFTVIEIANMVGISVRQLDRAFQVHTRMSPARFWRRMRLEHARYRLANSNRSITNIAYECGFADAAHLSRWFKTTYGETPKAFRKSRIRISES